MTEPTVLTGDKHTFTVGGVSFEVLHTPGETPDHVTVWIPQFKAAFVGDNYYGSFPNLYTLRGTQPRWAMDYVNSLNKVLALEPELVLPSHGQPIVGAAEVRRLLTRYRDAILYVHDETVKGMNEGENVLALMREISSRRRSTSASRTERSAGRSVGFTKATWAGSTATRRRCSARRARRTRRWCGWRADLGCSRSAGERPRLD